ncbi:MAG TPA: SDR family oxidoreductase, partial [Streptosporangiaceae bacterium]|nr:SDR family oxidoreductase [Streptosporangiaceae bacterium]
LTGRRALVTGSTRGIGAAMAAGLARAGATVVLHGRDLAKVDQARDQLATEVPGAELHSCAFDVADSDAIIAQAQRLDAELGGIDVLVNNAGMQFRSPLTEFPLDAWRQVLEVNLTSCFVLAQELARGMLARGHGKIINVCSLQTQLVRASTSAYAAAKSGLGSLTRTMCAEWAEGGIQANGLAPGYIGTDLNTVLVEDQEFSAWVRGRTPARRWGNPEDLAGPAVWLASSASDFVNGQVIYVDGGITAVL